MRVPHVDGIGNRVDRGVVTDGEPGALVGLDGERETQAVVLVRADKGLAQATAAFSVDVSDAKARCNRVDVLSALRLWIRRRPKEQAND